MSRLDLDIFYLHIPKCGGTSVRHAIDSCYRTSDGRRSRHAIALDPVASAQVIRMTDHTDYPDDTSDDYPILKFREHLLLYVMSQENTKYISGPFTFSETAYREFRGKYAFITVLRDPVKRWISSYFFNKYTEKLHRRIKTDFATYLRSHFGRSQGYEYIKFLIGRAHV